jgi:hypothetical protein
MHCSEEKTTRLSMLCTINHSISKLATSDEAVPHAATARPPRLHGGTKTTSRPRETAAGDERVVPGARRAQVIER